MHNLMQEPLGCGSCNASKLIERPDRFAMLQGVVDQDSENRMKEARCRDVSQVPLVFQGKTEGIGQRQ